MDTPAQCQGKQGFASYEFATKLARRSSGRWTKRMSAYKCPHCHLWHFGSGNRKPRND